MGEGTDQLRQEIDQKRDDAAQKIDQIEQQVMQTAQQMEQKVTNTAQQIESKVMDTRQQIEDKVMDTKQQIEDKVTDTVQQVREKFDWRGQVEERPLVAVGVAMLGGAILGGVLKDGDDHAREASHQMGISSQKRSGVGNAIRNAAKDSGLEDTIQKFAHAAFSNLGNQVRDVTERSFPGIAEIMKSDSSGMRRMDPPATPAGSAFTG
jgi:ElaB/YqjD/DUF883 family membrane-anchored ribosome-binding protein